LPLEPGEYTAQVTEADGLVLSGYTLEVDYREVGCGDGFVALPEQCDDGNTDNGDGCSSTCRYEYICGNNVRELGEQCDDGNTADGDDCNSGCFRENENIDTPDVYPAGWGEDGVLPFELFVSHTDTSVELWTSDGAGGCPGDTQIEIISVASGSVVASNDDGGPIGRGCSYLDLDMPAGEYRVELSSPSGDPLAGVFLHSNVFVTIDGDGVYGGHVPSPGGWDDFVLTLTEEAIVKFETSTGPGVCTTNTVLALLTDIGEFVDEDDDGGIGECSLMVGRYPAGEYVVRVNGWAGFSPVAPYDMDVEFLALDECGNFVVEDGETCDDGNTANGDGCSSSCQTE
jgi:cysteine-rich repeat protein